MEFLHRLWPRRGFAFPHFELTPLEFGLEAGEPCNELPVEEIVGSIGLEWRVVHLVQPTSRAGEVQASIEPDLRAARHSPPTLSPADELRNALAELRRSLA